MLSQDDEHLFISSINFAEIYRGILAMPEGRRRANLEAWFTGPLGPQSLFAGRILPFDEDAALAWGALMAAGRAAGKPRSDIDTFVAAIALANDCVVVTDNAKHFDGVRTINPMRSAI